MTAPLDETVRQHQREMAEELSLRLKRGKKRFPANVRSAFVVHPSRTRYVPQPSADAALPTPLSHILGIGGGRGGATRLKLYLTLLWTAKKAPFDVRFPPESWAYVIGLPDPLGSGRRTVVRNLEWLTREGFLSTSVSADATRERLILDDAGRGTTYVPPTQAKREVKKGDPGHDFNYYFKLPHHFWTKGLIAELNGVEISCLLILLDRLRHEKGPIELTPIWWSNATWTYRYGLSADSRQRGFKGLIAAGVVQQRPGHFIPSLDNPKGRHPTYVLVDTDLDGRDLQAEPPD